LYQQKVTVGRNLDYTREMYTINTSLWWLNKLVPVPAGTFFQFRLDPAGT
jgi:hypothetical protein